MKTYIYTETSSPVRGMNVCISVWRIKNNRPESLGSSDHHTKAWRGARAQAACIINRVDGLPWAKNSEHYHLRDSLGACDMYNDNGHPRNAVRVFGI